MLQRPHLRHTWYAMNVAALAMTFFGSLWVFFAAYAQSPVQVTPATEQFKPFPIVQFVSDYPVIPRMVLPVVADRT